MTKDLSHMTTLGSGSWLALTAWQAGPAPTALSLYGEGSAPPESCAGSSTGSERQQGSPWDMWLCRRRAHRDGEGGTGLFQIGHSREGHLDRRHGIAQCATSREP